MTNMLRNRLLRGDKQTLVLIGLVTATLLFGVLLMPNIQTATAAATSSVVGLEELDPIKTTPEKFIGRIIKGALGVVGTVALVMIVYAGITWMLAGVRGSATDIKKAQDTIFWSVVGLAVIFSSYALVHFIVQNIAP